MPWGRRSCSGLAVLVLARTPQQALVPLFSLWKLRPASGCFVAVALPASLFHSSNTSSAGPALHEDTDQVQWLLVSWKPPSPSQNTPDAQRVWPQLATLVAGTDV